MQSKGKVPTGVLFKGAGDKCSYYPKLEQDCFRTGMGSGVRVQVTEC